MVSLLTGARSSRSARWAVPAGVVAAVAAGVAVQGVSSASAPLPPRSAAQLLADLSKAGSSPFAGTVVETARLGLPSLPDVGSGSTSLSSLVTGSHTAKVWYAGPERVRVALVGSLAETDVIRNGRNVWQWTSGTNTATHDVLPPHPSKDRVPAAVTNLTPQQAAGRALAAVNPSTHVTVDGTATVAGRSAYELVLQPRDRGSLVGQVRIAVDSKVSVPLRVRVYAKGKRTPALEVGFTSVRFAKPAADLFTFRPPKGAKVTGPGAGSGAMPGRYDAAEPGAATPGTAKPGAATPGAVKPGAAKPGAVKPGLAQPGTGRRGAPQAGGPVTVGTGWTSVLVTRSVGIGDSTDSSAQALLQAATRVSGPYGSGRVLRTALVSALLLDDGRLLVGAVTPATLEAAAATPAAALPAAPAHR